jgi:beta-galactosidase GanA
MQMTKYFILAAVLMTSGAVIAAQAQAHDKAQPKAHPIPSIVQQDGRYALMVDGAPYLMLSMQTNNSSDWPATLPQVWPAAEALHVNTVETPIYWEQFEPKPGQFDTTQIDTVLNQARAHHIHLVLLWFGTWKNGSQHYMPDWMKLEPEKYSHVINKRGEPVDSPSPFAQASLDADIHAFTAFMKHLKTADPERTVLMVQVENETGTWWTLRDYSPEAEKLFAASVPADVLKAMNVSPGSRSANWQDVFGTEAEVNFHAWAIARYVGQIAAAGKAIYPLPLYVNAALRDPIKPGAPGSYESGGPTDNVLNIWKAEAPSIDILAPDIYNNDATAYLKILDLYHRPDNALFVPETSSSAATARFFFSALGRQAIGYSPFGLDYTRTPAPQPGAAGAQDSFLQPTAQNYQLIGPMMRDIARLNFEGKLQAVAEEPGTATQTLHFGDWDAFVTYGAGRGAAPRQSAEPTGRALVAQLAENQFLVTGMNAHVDFRPAGTEQQRRSQQIETGTGQTPSALIDGKWIHRQFLKVEEGSYENGSFKFRRILNGDQTDYGLNFSSAPQVLRVSVATY